jgi:iron complex outermembrane recepter protein
MQPVLIGEWDHFILTTGIEEKLDRYQVKNLIPNTSAENNQNDVFIHGKWLLNSFWRIFLGGRYAQLNTSVTNGYQNNYHNTVAVTTLGIEHEFNPHWTWFLRRDGNFRFPKVDEQTFTSSQVHGLQTQQGVSYETGLNAKFNKGEMQLNLFQLNLEHEIAFDPTKTITEPFGSNRNLDPTTRKGILWEGSYLASPKMTLHTSMTWLKANFHSGNFQGKKIPFVAKNNLEASLDYAVTSQWHIFTEAIYTGKRYALGDDANQTDPINSLVLLNLGTTYRLKHFEIEARINNLTNHYYNAMIVFEPSNQQSSFYPGAGRSYWVRLNWRF